MLLLEGEAQTVIVDDGRTEPVGRQAAPTWIGAIAVLTAGRSACACRPTTPCRVALIPADDFRRLALAQPAVHQRVMQQVRR